jgi:hypothetical protein
MFRKLYSVVAVIAVLSLLTGGAVQARPLAACPAAPAGLFQELYHWVASGLGSIGEKEGGAMDPNGNKHYSAPSISRAHGARVSPDRVAGKAG